MDAQTKEILIKHASEFLNDSDVFKAVLDSINTQNNNQKVVDMREAIIQQLNQKLGIVSDEHKSTMDAAQMFFETQKKINQTIIDLMHPQNFEDFLTQTQTTIKKRFQVKCSTVIIGRPEFTRTTSAHPALIFVNQNEILDYFTRCSEGETGNVALGRTVTAPFTKFYLTDELETGSQAAMRLGLNDPQISALLVMVSEDPDFFTKEQATDLLNFFREYYELQLIRWLAT